MNLPLRTSINLGKHAGSTAATPEELGGFETMADLVADLLAATELVPRDRLAAARGRAGTGSLAQALQAEGCAELEGIARSLARRFALPYIDLAEDRVSATAAELIPLKTLQRVVAVPVARTDDRLRIAVATRETSTASTSCASRAVTRSTSASRVARTSSRSSSASAARAS